MYSESLVDLCLETIVDNFPRYNSVFNTTKDDSMKRRFEFLQRKYSFEILSRLSTKGGSLEEYVDLLVNKYLKVLDTSWLRNCSWEKVTSKIAEIGPYVEKAMFKNTYVTDETPWQDTICHFPNLKSFSFHVWCTDLILKEVARFCPNIEEIDVRGSTVSSKRYCTHLCKDENGVALCTKLKKFFIGSTDILEDDVEYLLQNLPSLEVMDYRYLPDVIYSLHKKDLSCLDNVKPYKISTLDLSNYVIYPNFFDIQKVCFSVCPNLKYLTYGLLKNDDFVFSSKLSELEEFHIKNCSDSQINIDKLFQTVYQKLTRLTITYDYVISIASDYSRLSGATISLSTLSESCPRVKELNLHRVHFVHDDDSKPIFNSLTSVTFDHYTVLNNIKAIGLLLTSSENLESLTFNGCYPLSSDIKAQILKCTELCSIKLLYFHNSLIEKDFVKELLLNCRTLRCLNVTRGLKNDEVELQEFAKILPNKPKIYIINLRDSDDSDYDYYVDDDDDEYSSLDYSDYAEGDYNYDDSAII